MSFTHEQVMLAFAYMAYYGVTLTGRLHSQHDVTIARDITHALQSWRPVNNEWALAWGPKVSAFEGDYFDDNMMFVVKSKACPSKYVIAIRGTNPFSLKDWIIEDFDVWPMVSWPYGTQQKKCKPKISKATLIGLSRLQKMTATDGTPGAGQTLVSFLKSELLMAEKKGVKEALSLAVTGHSLGGALAPTLALWLKDIQEEAFSNKIQVSTVAFAGPTAGNRDFARYSDRRFGADCVRVFNDLDVVPHAWNTRSIGKLYLLYAKHLLLPGPIIASGLAIMLAMSLRCNYAQIKANTRPRQGAYKYFLYNYFAQAIYQHVIGYPEIMGMLSNHDIPLVELFSPQLDSNGYIPQIK